MPSLPSSIHRPPGGWRRAPLAPLAALLAAAAVLAAGAPAWAQPEPPGAVAGRTTLRTQVEERYEVTPIAGGIRLEPSEVRSAVSSIEITGEGRIAVNGEAVPREVLRTWLGDDAELILLLADLRPQARRELFGFAPLPAPDEAAAAASAEEAAPMEAPAAEVPEGAPSVEVEPPPAPPPPERRLFREHDLRHRAGSQFTLFRDLKVGSDETAREAVAVLGSVIVDGEVRGDVSSVLGSVWVDGRVEGAVVVVGGSLRVGPGAEVLRGAVIVGGRLDADPTAVVEGDVVEIPVLSLGASPWRYRGPRPLAGLWTAFWYGMWILLCALFACLTILVARGAVERTAEQAAAWWKAGLVGFLAQIFFLPLWVVVSVLLAISVVGIALLVPLWMVLPLAVLGISLLGYTGVARSLGGWVLRWRGLDSPVLSVLVGTLLLHVSLLAGLGLREGMGWSPFLGPLGVLLVLAGCLIHYFAWTIGIGAVLMAAFARRRKGGGGSASALPPSRPRPGPPPSDVDAGAAAASAIMAQPPLAPERPPTPAAPVASPPGDQPPPPEPPASTSSEGEGAEEGNPDAESKEGSPPDQPA